MTKSRFNGYLALFPIFTRTHSWLLTILKGTESTIEVKLVVYATKSVDESWEEGCCPMIDNDLTYYNIGWDNFRRAVMYGNDQETKVNLYLNMNRLWENMDDFATNGRFHYVHQTHWSTREIAVAPNIIACLDHGAVLCLVHEVPRQFCLISY